MESTGEQPAGKEHLNGGGEAQPGAAREMSLHLLRMLETRMDAAGIALTTEVQGFSTRLQLKLLAAATLFIAIWGGIVLLAIALPEPYRVPVLAAVVAAFVIIAIWAFVASKRRTPGDGVGSLRWFLEGLKLDLEVLSRSLHRRPEPAPTEQRSPPSDLAA